MVENDSDLELHLLGDPVTTSSGSSIFDINKARPSLETAPMLTGDAFEVTGSTIFPQRAVYGRILETNTGAPVVSPKLFINTNSPFSGIVCGVQGSGKSHSTSVLLEGCLISDRRLGVLPEPLSALLFHFDSAAGSGDVQPCEAAYMASLKPQWPSKSNEPTPPRVTVLVLPGNIQTMTRVYAKLPEVRVKPLHFSLEDISGGRLLAMMKVDQGQQMPLYMECIMSILRTMDTFSYDDFCRQLGEQKFSPTQKAMLDLRLKILDSCLKGGDDSNRVSNYFKKGELTIIDLSSPFMDGCSACGFFDIILGLYIEAKGSIPGKIIVLDEAHKYLTSSGSSSRLTESLLSVVRQQRHLGVRVIISTQEPTVVPATFLDLCSFIIAHRFSSPKWLGHLKEHISAVDTKSYSKVLTLRRGEAMIFSPASLMLRPSLADPQTDVLLDMPVIPLGQGYIHVRSRERITMDGGRSLLATDPTNSQTEESRLEASQSKYRVSPEFDTSWTPPQTVPSTGSPVSSRNSSVSQNFVSFPIRAPSIHNESTPLTPRPNTPPSPVATVKHNVDTSKLSRAIAVEARFRPLVAFLQQKLTGGQHQVAFSEVGTELKKSHNASYGKLSDYLNEAKEANLVQKSRPLTCARKYIPLVDIMQKLRAKGSSRPARSIVAEQLYKAHPEPGLPSTGTFKFKKYAEGAAAAGVIVFRGKEHIELVQF
ncbi:hypothetical protein K439DRAFT_1387349 [Ramaria rubella]|nr:hypothetical protein K439DRAFT_1387349 [Ramaria rubella]